MASSYNSKMDLKFQDIVQASLLLILKETGGVVYFFLTFQDLNA